MKKIELAQKVAHETGVTIPEAEMIINQAFKEIKNANSRGESFFARGFGTFAPKLRAETTGRNIRTGTTMRIPATFIPHFKPAPEFKESVARIINPTF